MSLEAKLQAATSEYQKLQNDLSNVVQARQQLDAQLSENEMVKKVSYLTPSVSERAIYSNHSEMMPRSSLCLNLQMRRLMQTLLHTRDHATV